MSACSSGSCETTYNKKRYFGYAIISMISMILPFIRVNGNHFFLLSFDKKQLHLFFTSFDMQELYLMPFLLILLFLTIFFITTLGGRFWCGWSCPQTIFRVIFRDLIETKLLGIRRSIKNKQTKPKKGFKEVLAILIWSFLAVIAASNLLWYFIPPEDFFVYLQEPLEHTVLLGFLASLSGFLIYDIIMLKEDFCIYVCPYARVQSVMFDHQTVQVMYDTQRGGDIYDEHKNLMSSKPKAKEDECTGCEACVRICPTHIDIRKGMQLECINCLECSDACSKVMGKFGKESLINWTSPAAMDTRGKTKFVRFRTIAYGVALSIALITLFFMGTKKEHMLLNINRTVQLYEIKDQGKTIENAYLFLFQNTDSKNHIYYFDTNNKNITIKKPTKQFELDAGQKLKKLVILKANKNLSKNEDEDNLIKLKITAYAVDDKEKISIFRETRFIYPSHTSIKNYLAKK